MKLSTKLLALTILLSLTFTNCKKAEAGPKGDPGPAGSNGVANIQSSNITTTNGSWNLDTFDNSYNATITVTGITQNVLDKGAVMVYIGNGTGSEWSAMPFSYQGVEFNYSIKLGQVLIYVTLDDGSAPGNPGGQQFKIVVIPPAMVRPNVNVKSYSETKTAYGLSD